MPEVGDAIWEAEEGLAAPASWDWRNEGAVLGVKNQGACGSCWAFSATGCLEGQLAIKHKKKISLSEQNLMDCSTSYGNEACNGGLMTQAFEYVKNNGINSEADYPYEHKKGSCRFQKNKSVTKVGKIFSVSRSENALKAAILSLFLDSVGPISVGIDASSLSAYGGGVYNPRSCSEVQLNHGVLAVGYGDTGNQEYWIVKNSWGASWGENGYVRMARNHNNKCGIVSMANYVDIA
nr:unnamed protein product [Callosobruchus analis]